MTERRGRFERQTTESRVVVEVNLDGGGVFQGKTGVGMLDHMLAQLAQHGLFDINIEASGDMAAGVHHLVEDVAIALGRAFGEALGDRRGIVRMGHAVVPMDEALALVAVDLGGRGWGVVEATWGSQSVGDLPTDMVSHFLQSLALEGRLNLHARILAVGNDHHQLEALFKSLARALGAATRPEPRLAGQVPSTKGKIDA